MSDHKKILHEAHKLLEERGAQYGDHRPVFRRIAAIASAMLGREVVEYDVAVFLLATKLGRVAENPVYRDNYVDGVNYLAFAAEFSANAPNAAPYEKPEDFFGKK